ncbi:MAG: transglycosylase domain-containing protein [Salinivirgaceae bacterium]|nr:transglycosylase domain-containing protein [Salinivirgaceae bacterium]
MAISISKRLQWKIIIWSLVVFPVVLIVVMFYNIWNGNLGFMPSFEELENPKSNLASEVYSEDGVLLGTYFKENRSTGTYNELSPYLVDALVSTEDQRYYKHSGVDFPGLVRVFFKTIVSGNKSSGGGSTISQQLAKMLFPRETFSNSLQMVNRKFREWVIAIKLERSYTKEEIIAMYLNQFDFLNLAVGVKSAAKIYFNTTPQDLRIEQAAMLVGMAKNPALFNPIRRPEQTAQRRNVVLFQMLNNNKLTRAEYDSLKQLPLGLDFHKVDHKLGSATYFREFLRIEMNANKPERKNYRSKADYIADSIEWATNPLRGWCNRNLKPDGTPYNIYKDGLKIYTTVNSKMQDHAEAAVRDYLKNTLQKQFDILKKGQPNAPFSSKLTTEQVNTVMNNSMRWSERYRVLSKVKKMSKEEIEENFNTPTQMSVFTWHGDVDTVMTPMDSIRYYNHFLQSGLMSMDPHSGYVKAYVGGIDYRHFQYDHVTKAKRQVGSTFKPFLYTLAMMDGFTPCYYVLNVPYTYTDPTTGKQWSPDSDSPSSTEGKMITLKYALAHSLNNVATWLMIRFNPKAVVQLAKNMGIKSEVPEYPAICLGVADLTLSEMVGAYCCFANKGVYTQPIFVTRIEDKNGNVLANFQPVKHEAISERTAYLMLTMLQGVVRKGTGSRIWRDDYPWKITAQVGAKTGTTQENSDGWFMGVTPNLVTGVWTGAENRSVHFDQTTYGQGAYMALPIWAGYMRKVYDDGGLPYYESDKFDKPADWDEDFDCPDYEEKPAGGNSEDIEDEFYF